MKIPYTYTEDQIEAIEGWRVDSAPHEMVYVATLNAGAATVYALIVDESNEPPEFLCRLVIAPDGVYEQTDARIVWQTEDDD
jgi:hypothetical protein